MTELQSHLTNTNHELNSVSEVAGESCPTCGQSLARKALKQTVTPLPERQYEQARIAYAAAEREGGDTSKYTREMLIRQVIRNTHPDLVATKAPTYLVGPDDSMELLRKNFPPPSSEPKG